MAKLFVVATPIGNREDISGRAQKVLNDVSWIVSESPRASLKLLGPMGLSKKIVKLFGNNKKINVGFILKKLSTGEDLALISEAGTPGINDPGGLVVDRVRVRGYKVVPVPGPNAAITAASASGFKMDEFVFKGFVPHKKGRQTFFEELTRIKSAVIFYESPHRFDKTRKALAKWLPRRQVLVARELTKLHEQTWRGTATALAALSSTKLPVRGEFVLVLAPKNYKKIKTSLVKNTAGVKSRMIDQDNEKQNSNDQSTNN